MCLLLKCFIVPPAFGKEKEKEKTRPSLNSSLNFKTSEKNFCFHFKNILNKKFKQFTKQSFYN